MNRRSFFASIAALFGARKAAPAAKFRPMQYSMGLRGGMITADKIAAGPINVSGPEVRMPFVPQKGGYFSTVNRSAWRAERGKRMDELSRSVILGTDQDLGDCAEVPSERNSQVRQP